MFEIQNRYGFIPAGFEELEYAKEFIFNYNRDLDLKIESLYIEIGRNAPCVDMDRDLDFECKCCEDCICAVNKEEIERLKAQKLNIVGESDNLSFDMDKLKMLIESLNNGNEGLNLTVEAFQTEEKARKSFKDIAWKYCVNDFQGILGKEIKCQGIKCSECLYNAFFKAGRRV